MTHAPGCGCAEGARQEQIAEAVRAERAECRTIAADAARLWEAMFPRCVQPSETDRGQDRSNARRDEALCIAAAIGRRSNQDSVAGAVGSRVDAPGRSPPADEAGAGKAGEGAGSLNDAAPSPASAQECDCYGWCPKCAPAQKPQPGGKDSQGRPVADRPTTHEQNAPAEAQEPGTRASEASMPGSPPQWWICPHCEYVWRRYNDGKCAYCGQSLRRWGDGHASSAALEGWEWRNANVDENGGTGSRLYDPQRRCRADVWANGVWHTWDEQATGGENGEARSRAAAEDDVVGAILRQRWYPSTPAESASPAARSEACPHCETWFRDGPPHLCRNCGWAESDLASWKRVFPGRPAPCGCEESEGLRAEVERLSVEAHRWLVETGQVAARLVTAERELDEALAECEELGVMARETNAHLAKVEDECEAALAEVARLVEAAALHPRGPYEADVAALERIASLRALCDDVRVRLESAEAQGNWPPACGLAKALHALRQEHDERSGK